MDDSYVTTYMVHKQRQSYDGHHKVIVRFPISSSPHVYHSGIERSSQRPNLRRIYSQFKYHKVKLKM